MKIILKLKFWKSRYVRKVTKHLALYLLTQVLLNDLKFLSYPVNLPKLIDIYVTVYTLIQSFRSRLPIDK